MEKHCVFFRVCIFLLFIIAGMTVLNSCADENKQVVDIENLIIPGNLEYPYKIVVTSSFVYDIVDALAGHTAEIYKVLNSGVDPHTYTPTRSDIVHIYYSDIIVYSGLHLEGGMYNVFNRIGNKYSIFSIGNVLGEKNMLYNEAGVEDPHIWMDAMIWKEGTFAAAEKLSKFDPTHADEYRMNAEIFAKKLIELDNYMKTLFSTIPKKQRVLITSHDAFSYFGKAYDFEVYGIQGISTVSEASLKHIGNLIDLIIEKNVQAIFVESSVSEKYVKAIIEGAKDRGYELQEGGLLYADSIGAPGTAEDNYIGMMKYNAEIITKALGGRLE